MGGYGSGQRVWESTKNTVGDSRALIASRLRAEGILRDGVRSSGSWLWMDADTGERRASIGYLVNTVGNAPTLRLFYTLTRTGEALDYRVPLQTTHPNYGGRRWWLSCPLAGCGRRCGVLYLPPGGRFFGCRKCYRLAYASQREGFPDRCIRKADKIRRRLGGKAGMAHRFPGKPSGMHWRTYRQLQEKAELAELQGMAAILGDMERRLTPLLGRMNRKAAK